MNNMSLYSFNISKLSSLDYMSEFYANGSMEPIVLFQCD